MATPLRHFVQNGYYHVYNRGIRKQNIFLNTADYERFLSKVTKYTDDSSIKILCYCLMTNHFHFLLKQTSEIPLTIFMQKLGTSYSKYFNIKYQQVGSLFQNRFQAKLIETDEYLLHLSRYIHRNPIDLLSTKNALSNYPWSSYNNYINGAKNSLVDSKVILDYFAKNYPLADYKTFVEFDVQAVI